MRIKTKDKRIAAILLGILCFYAVAFAQDESQVYLDEEYGFTFTAPEGWIKQEGGHYDALIEFARPGQKDSFIGVTTDDISKETAVQTAFEFTQKVFKDYEINPKFTIYEKPKEVTLNDTPAGTFTFGAQDSPARTTIYQLLIDKTILSFFLSYHGERELEELKPTIDSFRFVNVRDSFYNLKQLKNIHADFKPVTPDNFAVLKQEIIKAIDTVKTFKSYYVVEDPQQNALAADDFKSISWQAVFVAPKEFEVKQIIYPHKTKDVWRVVGGKTYSRFTGGIWMETPDFMVDTKVDRRMQKIKELHENIYKVFAMAKYKALFDEMPIGMFDDEKNGYIILDFEPQNTGFLSLDILDSTASTARLWVWVDKNDKFIRFARLVFRGKDAQGRNIKQKHEHYFRALNTTPSLGMPPVR